MYLANFCISRPRFESTQEETLEWFLALHVEAEAKRKSFSKGEKSAFEKKLRRLLWHVACKPGNIEKRGHVLSDYNHRDFSKMRIFNLEHSFEGKGLEERLKVFEEEADLIFQHFYPENALPPHDLIHASCTGYISPSSAQKIASKRKWEHRTTVTHAYHMGCYAAFPAIRMAKGFVQASGESADIVHTEICGLHPSPTNHSPDQLVSQSLFADGFIKYTVSEKEGDLALLALQEKIIPDSLDAMKWNLADWGFTIELAREVPQRIRENLEGYLALLAKKAGYTPAHFRKNAHFAIHPGGPKILQQIQELFGLKDAQIEKSVAILQNFGNMSSATIPHIWESIVRDENIPAKTPIVSMAFGPGLSISGAILEKCTS